MVLNPHLLFCNPSFWPLDYVGIFAKEIQKPNIDCVGSFIVKNQIVVFSILLLRNFA